ncbi:hypothetical protein EDD17DRAFT_1059535 [Pisolithus thermaeus]|nr:hypothetical protein EDD17DRAFT_1059535 [Pisolithus thermaeus]
MLLHCLWYVVTISVASQSMLNIERYTPGEPTDKYSGTSRFHRNPSFGERGTRSFIHTSNGIQGSHDLPGKVLRHGTVPIGPRDMQRRSALSLLVPRTIEHAPQFGQVLFVLVIQ